MKGTIISHLEKLPEPYRTQSIENTNPALHNNLVLNKFDALRSAFIWECSIQGNDYWKYFYNSLLSQPKIK